MGSDGSSGAAAIRRYLRPGGRVAVADGAGGPVGLFGPLSEAARDIPGLSLVLGWCVAWSDELQLSSFADVRSIMGGYGLRKPIREGLVRYLPVRIGALPALLAGPLRPDLVVASLRPADGGWAYGAEVGWVQAMVDAGVPVVAEVNHGLPAASATGPVPRERVTVVAEVERPPAEVPSRPATGAWVRLGAHVARLVPEGSAVQVGPGMVAEAALAALEVPVHVDSGVLVDGVADLDRRGLLLGTPSGAYLAGTADLYRWADGRPLLRGVEHTHDLSRLAARPLVAINTALQIDRTGQVNVEGLGGEVVGGVGGHPDYAVAASRSGGLSIVALPTDRRGERTLVDRLEVPASTARSDVDVVVTENGVADLRGLADEERGERLDDLWG